MARTPPDLSGIYLKLERAEQHIQTFRHEVAAFRERKPEPFGFRPEPTVGPGQSVTYDLFAIIREKPPRELGLIAGDAIQNIRSALDHLVYELAPPRVRRKRNTQFPIFDDECEFKVLGAPKIQGITGDERTLIERVQPYAATKVVADDPLAVLRKLSNRDKHHALVTMIATVSETASWVASNNANIRFTYIAPGPVEDGTKIVSFTATPQDPALNMDVHPQSGLQIQIEKTGLVSFRLGAVELLELLLHYVRHDVIEMWFRYGYMPRTWAQVEAAAQPP